MPASTPTQASVQRTAPHLQYERAKRKPLGTLSVNMKTTAPRGTDNPLVPFMTAALKSSSPLQPGKVASSWPPPRASVCVSPATEYGSPAMTVRASDSIASPSPRRSPVALAANPAPALDDDTLVSMHAEMFEVELQFHKERDGREAAEAALRELEELIVSHDAQLHEVRHKADAAIAEARRKADATVADARAAVAAADARAAKVKREADAAIAEARAAAAAASLRASASAVGRCVDCATAAACATTATVSTAGMAKGSTGGIHAVVTRDVASQTTPKLVAHAVAAEGGMEDLAISAPLAPAASVGRSPSGDSVAERRLRIAASLFTDRDKLLVAACGISHGELADGFQPATLPPLPSPKASTTTPEALPASTMPPPPCCHHTPRHDYTPRGGRSAIHLPTDNGRPSLLPRPSPRVTSAPVEALSVMAPRALSASAVCPPLPASRPSPPSSPMARTSVETHPSTRSGLEFVGPAQLCAALIEMHRQREAIMRKELHDLEALLVALPKAD